MPGQGARPLFCLEFVVTGVLAPEVIVAVVEGVARGCRENGCVLLGGETAEMPGFYPEGEYDVAGLLVGGVQRARAVYRRPAAPGRVGVAPPPGGAPHHGHPP